MSSASPASAAAGSTNNGTTAMYKHPRIHACVLCQQRKVKCDRQNPCAGCVKAGAECVASVPAPPRRRKRKLPEVELQAKLLRYRELLRGYGAGTDDEEGDGEGERDGDGGRDAAEGLEAEVREAKREAGERSEWVDRELRRASVVSIPKRPKPLDSGRVHSSPEGPERGKMISERDMSKYLDNNLWTGLSAELPPLKDMLHRPDEVERYDSPMTGSSHADGGSFLFSSLPPASSLTTLHPPPVHIFRLWQTFLDNVNPLSKLLHGPTMQHQVLTTMGNPASISKGMEALMFAIYAAAVASLDNDECISTMGESRSVLLVRYSTAAQQALIRAQYLKTSDLVVLQAYTLFLLSMRQQYDPHTLWILTGVAVRIGQRLGVHRDGASLGLSIFETEMRRRICWQIILLDSRSAQLAGTGISVTANLWDTKLPANINDSDLSPEMMEMPMAYAGITDMVFCLIRYEFGNFLRGPNTLNNAMNGGFDGNWQRLSSNTVPKEEKDRILDELENTLETKFLRYCDPLIPLHMLSSAVARTAICKMRLVAHHPRQYPDNGASMPQDEKDMLFATSLKMIEYDTLGQTTKTLKRFLWHINVYFQLDAFVYLLSELRTRTSGTMVDSAWEHVQSVYDNHTELIHDTANALYVAIGNLTLKAWEAREAELGRMFEHRTEAPRFITVLRAQRMPMPALLPAGQGTGTSTLERAAANGSAAEEGLSNRAHAHTQYGSQALIGYPAAGGEGEQNERHDYEVFDPMLTAGQGQELSPVDWDYWNDLLEANELMFLDGGAAGKLFG